MAFLKTLLPLFGLAIAVRAGNVTQADFTGVGQIFVLNSSSWATAQPDQTVGCLDNNGRFISVNSTSECGIFSRLDDYPYTLASPVGNCSFQENTVTNNDSIYGKLDHAWSCNASYVSDIYDELYTIDGFNYPFLCFGDVACFYDGPSIPAPGQKVPLWQYRWGSQQMGITPGHVQLQLLWNKLGDLPKREEAEVAPGPRVQLKDGAQMPLLAGQQKKA